MLLWLRANREGKIVRIDRVAENVFVFISDLYAQVVSTVLLTEKGAIVIDTLPFPSEAREVLEFVQDTTEQNARYVINTHHHADHVYGTYLFEGAEVISHDQCRDFLERIGQEQLERVKKDTPALAEVKLALPNVTFQERMGIQLGQTQLHLFHTPGHTPDGISIFIEGEKILVAGDTLMPVPYIVGGNIEQLKRSLLFLKELFPHFIIQGHGPVLLRGEVDEAIESSISYLSVIVSKVEELIHRGDPPSKLREIDIESCGKSRIPLDGLVSKLHLDNLIAVYRMLTQEEDPLPFIQGKPSSPA